MTITLPETTDCSATGAVCSDTDQGKPAQALSHSLTARVEGPAPDPLTASLSNVPDEHQGSGQMFTFNLAFSEDFKLSYKVLRDDGALTGGKVDKAKRVDGRNDLREIHIKPDGNGAVSITLPATTDRDATGAICTEDGRKLSNTSSATVAGPVGVSVADAEVVEAAGAVLNFGVTLPRAASQSLTIDYATVRRHSERRKRLHRNERDAHHQRREQLGDDRGPSARRLARRRRRDAHAVEPLERHDHRRIRNGHHHQRRGAACGAARTLRTHGRAPCSRAGRGARERAPGTGLRRTVRRPPDQPGHGPGLRPGVPAADGRRTDERRNRRQRRGGSVQEPGTRSRAGTARDHGHHARNAGHAGPAPTGRLPGRARPGARDGLADRGLQLRAQPRDIRRRGHVVLEPKRELEFPGAGRPARPGRRRTQHHVRCRLRPRADGHRRVAVPHPRHRQLRRRRHRTDDLQRHRALPLDRVQGKTSGSRCGRSPATAPGA